MTNADGFWGVALRAMPLVQLHEFSEQAGGWRQLEAATPDEWIRWGVGPDLAETLHRAGDTESVGRVLRCWEAGFPESLRTLAIGPDAQRCGPPVLFVQGDIERLSQPSVSVVGTRRCSQSGRGFARELGRTLAASGRVVVSGLASGIDTAAHLGALDAGQGRTVAVLGHGLGRTYPSANAGLRRRILEEGGAVVSSWPDAQPPARWTFPVRNRWVAGLSQCTVVVEAPFGSGALLTAKDALAFGRTVFVCPSRPGESHTAGGQSLLAQAWMMRAGTVPPTSVAGRLDEPAPHELARVVPLWSLAQLGVDGSGQDGDPPWLQSYLSGLSVLDVAHTHGLDPWNVHRELQRLEVEGRVVRMAGQRYCRAGSAP